MAKRGNPGSGTTAPGGNADQTTLDRVSGVDGQGDEIDTVSLEDEEARAALNLDDDSDDSDPQDSLTKSRGRPPVITDPRDALAKAFDARRKGEPLEDDDAEDGDAQEGNDAEDGEVLILGQDGKPKQTAEPADKTPAQRTTTVQSATTEPSDDQPVTVVVDGAKVSTTYGELKKNFQIGAAAESRLREANGILDRARTATRTEAPADRQDQGDRAPPVVETRQPTKPQIDTSKYVPLIQRIQLGDDADAAAALVEAATDIAMQAIAANGQTNAVDRSAVRRVVEEARTEDAAHAEINEALTTVATQHQDIIGNEYLWPGAAALAHKTAVAALRKIGVPDGDLALPAADVLQGYADLRQDSRYREQLRPMTELFVEAANTVRKAIGMPEPRREAGQGGGAPRIGNRAGADQGQGQSRIVRAVDSDRAGRKGRIVEQPRSGSVRTDYTGSDAPPRTSRSDTVAKMAAARGQTVVQ